MEMIMLVWLIFIAGILVNIYYDIRRIRIYLLSKDMVDLDRYAMLMSKVDNIGDYLQDTNVDIKKEIDELEDKISDLENSIIVEIRSND
jgi:cell division protein FtsB